MYRILTLLLVLTTVLTSTAQQTAPLPKSAAAVKQKVESLPFNAPITVVPTHGEEEFGTLVSRNEEGFTFYDVDRKSDVTTKYVDVKKITNGYGGYNSFTKRHTPRARGIIITAAVIAGLLVLAIAAGRS
jgi:hypothetical protein